MPLPTSISDLNTTASLNSPSGSESLNTVDDYIRALSGIIKTQDNLNARKGANSDITSLSGLTTPLSVTQGGTGASTSAATAFALKGANTDITSLAGITGVLGWMRGAGAGATYTQTTNKQTSVNVTTRTGVITMNNAALAANAKATFLISYTGATNNDIATVGIRGGVANEQNYNIMWRATGSGIQVILWNTSGGSLSEAVEVIYGIFQGSAN